MTVPYLTQFFMWCTIINGSLMLFWSTAILLFPDFIYQTQRRWFPVARETHNAIIYSFMAIFKILFIIFNLVPFAALRILA